MKKIAPIVAIAFFVGLAFTSCKKDYTCTCSYKMTGFDTTVKHELGKTKKKDAESSCETYESQLNAAWAPFGGSGSCSI